MINVTPIGMAFTPAVIDGAKVAFDVLALPPETPFIRYGKTQVQPVTTGTEVMALQAAEQFALYTGVPPTKEQARCAAKFARG